MDKSEFGQTATKVEILKGTNIHEAVNYERSVLNLTSPSHSSSPFYHELKIEIKKFPSELNFNDLKN